jgi:hypothetical protein
VRNTRSILPVVLTLVAAILAGCKAQPRIRPVKMGDVETGANSVEAARRQLEGTWDLASLETYPTPGGPATKSEGASAVLTYDAYGNLHIIGKPGSSGSMPAAVELLQYEGRAVIDPAKQQLKLQAVKGNTDPNATLGKDVGVERVRQYKIENGVLTISVIDPASGQVSATTTWKKRS